MVIDCHVCVDGITSAGSPCQVCSGSGEIDFLDSAFRKIKYGALLSLKGLVWDTILTALNVIKTDVSLPTNVFESYVILEALNATEHNALTDTQKDGIKVILLCGKVDLNEGQKSRVYLWNWFGAESTTVANLTALLT